MSSIAERPRTRLLRGATCLAAAVALLSAPFVAQAHDRSVSQSTVRVEGHDVTVRVRSRSVDLSALSPALAAWTHRFASGATEPAEALPTELVTALHTHFRVSDSGGAACPPSPPLRLSSPPAELRVLLRFSCAAPPARFVVTPWPVPGHHHMTHLEGSRDDRTVLVVGGPGELPLGTRDATAAPTGMAATLRVYLVHGVRHAATGWDHAAFVLLLLVAVTRARDALVLVTGFTLGHALTLSLAALSVLTSDARAVESLIAGSVVLVAAENVGRAEPAGMRRALPVVPVALMAALLAWLGGVPALGFFALVATCAGGLLVSQSAATAPRHDGRLALAVGFGLIHGLGFASGFDADGPFRVGRLVAFNVGVELAQLGWLALGWAALSALGRVGAAWQERAVLGFSVVAGSGATYACVVRALAP